MAKRFIDTEIWDKEKFCNSSDKHKILTLFITSKCDQIGVFKMANMLITAYVGSPVSESDILSIPVDIEKIGDGKYWLSKFCKFQYGELKETCKPHKKYIEMLKYEGLIERVCKGYTKGIDTLQEKEEDKEEDNSTNNKRIVKEMIPDFIDHSVWADFVAMRKKIKKPMTERAMKMIWTKIEKLGKENSSEILEQSILKCWQDVFQVKKEYPFSLEKITYEKDIQGFQTAGKTFFIDKQKGKVFDEDGSESKEFYWCDDDGFYPKAWG